MMHGDFDVNELPRIVAQALPPGVLLVLELVSEVGEDLGQGSYGRSILVVQTHFHDEPSV